MLKQHEARRKVPELASEIGVSEATIYTWKSKYGGMDVSEAQRLKSLEDETPRQHGGLHEFGPRAEASRCPQTRSLGASKITTRKSGSPNVLGLKA